MQGTPLRSLRLCQSIPPGFNHWPLETAGPAVNPVEPTGSRVIEQTIASWRRRAPPLIRSSRPAPGRLTRTAKHEQESLSPVPFTHSRRHGRQGEMKKKNTSMISPVREKAILRVDNLVFYKVLFCKDSVLQAKGFLQQVCQE